jgi:hypothetical protein
MAYGMAGELTKAKETFEYGAQQDSTYPLFHYNLACADAELGDLGNALEQLAIAFQYKAYSNPGEGMPDPAKDESFKRYSSDPKFTKLAKQLCPTSMQTQNGWVCR